MNTFSYRAYTVAASGYTNLMTEKLGDWKFGYKSG